jgi:hypothetical protein
MQPVFLLDYAAKDQTLCSRLTTYSTSTQRCFMTFYNWICGHVISEREDLASAAGAGIAFPNSLRAGIIIAGMA